MVLFSAVIIASVGTSTYVGFQYVKVAVIDSSLEEMKSHVNTKKNEIRTLHERASEDMIFAIKNPQFKDYFELPRTKEGNEFDKNGVIQFSSSQREIKDDLDTWIFHFQNKFNVDETCLIDLTGQEHTRLVFGEIAPDDELSSEEKATPFFSPSFAKGEGQVHIQYPYVSPDSERWVFAYVTPIVLDNKEKPAIYHFEMPLQIFQDLVKTDVGRMYVIDHNGFLIADSEYEFSQIPISEEPSEYFPHTSIISESSEFENLLQEMKGGKDGFGTYTKDNKIHYVSYILLPPFGWTLVYEKPQSLMLIGNSNLSSLENTEEIVAVSITGGGLLAVWMMSSRLSKPLKKLARECREQDPTRLKKVDAVLTNDEISEVATAFNELVEQVNDVEKQEEEFRSMITHELKTPLFPIMGWCQTLKKSKIMGELTDKQSNAIDSIYENSKRLQQLIGDVLDVQKLNLKRIRFDFIDVNISMLMKFIYKNLQHIMESKKIQFINLTTDKNLNVESDRGRIEQVLNNLILNAVDFVPNENGRIIIGAENQGDSVLFYVKDNGPGIPKEKMDSLFRKFYHGVDDVKREHGGSGLGLIISQGIINGLGGGGMWVQTYADKGTAFYFTIPKKHFKDKNEIEGVE